ncbi:hypothetical protein Ptr902_05805 [Pyrenophora tritici-repentis]|nr:hypothetical protein Ptr902_05805 [Pyrenophora tritici-repentis]
MANKGTHERDLPTLAALAEFSDKEQCYTEISFCVPNSLAFAKRLTWEQTSWIPSAIDYKFANPISAADAHLIAHHLRHQLGQTVTPSAIRNALLLGSTYEPSADGKMSKDLGTYPHIFVIFPHISTHAATDETFLKIWHDDIVKPAFDRAWADSGLVTVSGCPHDSRTRILPSRGISTTNDALSFIGFHEHFRNRNSNTVRTYWPSWQDHSSTPDIEGQYTGLRSTTYASAWTSIKGMLKDHPQLPQYQDPVLLALCRGRVFVNAWLNTHDRFRCLAQEWDKYVDSRWMQQGSFKIVEGIVMGTLDEANKMVAKDGASNIVYVGDDKGNIHKRRIGDEDGEDELDDDMEGNGHQTKKAKI